MKLTLRRTLWAVILLFLFLLAVIVAAPEIEAGAWRGPLAQELSRALGRPVQVQSVRYQLYPSPGLSASSLVIPEDPAFGIEPLAYVTELQVGVKLIPLMLGRLEVSSVRLVDASVNISRTDARGWNVSRLLLGMATAARSGSPPALELRACRVNYRFGLVKSSYYLSNVDLDLQPPSESHRGMSWSFEASPARTDRAEQGFGRFTGDGSWYPARGPGGSVEIGVELETSAVSEVVTLLAGQDLGLQGRVSSRARLDGPLDNVRVRGQFEFIEVDRAGLFGFRGKQFKLPLEGTINLPGQSFDLQLAARPVESAPPPIEIVLSSTDTLIDPRWKAEFLFKAFPAATLADLSQRLGLGLPDGMEVTGDVDGSLAFQRGGPASGQITVKTATLRSQAAGQVSAPEAALAISGDEIRLSPTTATTEGGAEINISGVWNTRTDLRELDLKFAGAAISELNRPATALGAAIPLLNACVAGQATGAFRYRSAAVAPWTGAATTAKLNCPVEGAAAPFVAGTATVVLRDDGWTLRSPSASWASLSGAVALAWKNGARRPLRLEMSIAEATAADLETLLLPTLARNRGLLDRTLSFGRASTPSWLAARSLSGHLTFGKLTFAGVEASPVEANLFWDGANVELSALTMRIGDASLNGRMTVSLAGSAPSYVIASRLDDYPHDSVSASLDFVLRSSGLGKALLENLQASGEFQFLGAEANGEPIRPFRGAFDYSARRNISRLRVSSAEAGIGGETYVGSGLVATDGRLHLDLAGPSRAQRLSISLSPWLVEARP